MGVLLVWGSAALLVSIVMRGLNAYGNMHLYRCDDSVVQWLHVSKYPPSLTFVMLALGLMAVIVAGSMLLQQRV